MTNVNVNVITADDDHDQTTLQMIAEEKHLEMMKRLLMTNINVNIITAADYDQTTLHAIAE
jgi:hypothetical protein